MSARVKVALDIGMAENEEAGAEGCRDLLLPGPLEKRLGGGCGKVCEGPGPGSKYTSSPELFLLWGSWGTLTLGPGIVTPGPGTGNGLAEAAGARIL